MKDGIWTGREEFDRKSYYIRKTNMYIFYVFEKEYIKKKILKV